MILGVAVVVTQSAYAVYVEVRFAELLNSLEAKRSMQVAESRCLGEPSEEILLLPILKSWISDSYPFPQSDPKAESYMSSMYYHGFWFNYSKHIYLDGEQLIAYWSIREDKWHVGNFHWIARNRLVWQCVCESCQVVGPEGECGIATELRTSPQVEAALHCNDRRHIIPSPAAFGAAGYALASGTPAQVVAAFEAEASSVADHSARGEGAKGD